jgi:hypothetical protein
MYQNSVMSSNPKIQGRDLGLDLQGQGLGDSEAKDEAEAMTPKAKTKTTQIWPGGASWPRPDVEDYISGNK